MALVKGHLSTFSKDFSESTGLISYKFHVQCPGKGGKKVYIFCPCHTTRIATIHIYMYMVKTLKNVLW